MFSLYPKSYSRLLALLLFSLLSLVVTSSAFAQGNINFRLQPHPDPAERLSSKNSYFAYDDMPAGTVIKDSVVVVNTGDTVIELYLYPSDPDVGGNGGLAFPTAYGESATNTGSWLELSETVLTLQPEESRLVPFTFAIPDGISGEFVAGIIAQDAAQSEQESDGPINIKVVQRAITSVLVTVAGAVPLEPELEIQSLEADLSGRFQVVKALLHNKGNASLRAEGSLIIRDAQDTIVREMPLQLGYFVAGGSLDYAINLEPELDFGEYQTTLTLNYEGGTAEETTNLSLAEPETAKVQVVEADPSQPTIIYQQPAIPTEWLMVGGGLIVLLVVVVLFQSMIMMRSRKG